MEAAHIVLLLAVTIAVGAIAGYLIAIVWHLRAVFRQLEVILGAVAEVVNQSEGLDRVIGEIARDLTASQQSVEACVARLDERAGGSEHEADRDQAA